MTSLQLASMIARRTPWKTVSQLPMEEANALCAALNQALQAWFQRAGASHTASRRSTVLHAPVACLANMITGSRRVDFTSAPDWVSEAVGATVRLEGDPRWNRIVAPETLLHAWLGDTEEVAVTLYHDCISLPAGVAGVCSPVTAVLPDSEALLPDAPLPAWSSSQGSAHTTGRPERHQIETLDAGPGSCPSFALRVWPMPSTDVTLCYSVVQYFTLSTLDLQAPRVLPVPEDVAAAILLPLALDHAAAQGLLDKDTDTQRLAADAAAALERIAPRTMLPTTTTQWLGTTPGF